MQYEPKSQLAGRTSLPEVKSLYGTCMGCSSAPATDGVVFKDGSFEPAHDRVGDDTMTVSIADIVFCLGCATQFAIECNLVPDSGGVRCDNCPGPATHRVTGNTHGTRCLGHVQQFLRGRTAIFFAVTSLPPNVVGLSTRRRNLV